MKQFNVPRKIVSTIQMWGSLLLILLALIFSFTSIITLKTFENASDISEMISEVVPGADLEIPEEIEVSAPKLVGSISLIAKVVGVSIDAANPPTTPEEAEDQAKAREELDAYLESEEGKEDITTAIALAVTVMNTFDFEGNDGILAMVLNVFISLVGFLGVLILVFVIPIMLIVKFIQALITCLKNMKTPENGSAAVGNKLSDMVSMPLVLMLFQCVVPGMSYASGIVTICILSIISVVLNFVVSRLREYPAKQFRYLNILQLPAFVGIIGFLVFFFNLINTGIFKSFTSGTFAAYMTSSLAIDAAGGTPNNSYIVDAILMLVYLVIVLSCTTYLDKATRRFSCTVKADKPNGLIGLFMKGKAKDNGLVTAIISLAIFIIPTVVSGMKHYYLDPTSTADEGVASFLILTPDQESALTGALIGIIIMIIADISVLVLKKIFCKDLTEDEATELMMGKAKTSAEKLAEAEAIVAEAEAAKAAEAAQAPADAQ